MTSLFMSARRRALPILCAAVASATTSQALAQGVPYGIGDAVRESEQTRRTAPPVRATPAPVLPQLVEPRFTLADKETLLIRRFELTGDGPVATSDVHAVLEPFQNRKLTLAQIYEAADAVTTLYRSRGYLLAKAYVPAQNARGGVLRLKIVPGAYGERTVDNQSLVRDPFVRGVIDQAIANEPYIRRDQLERAMLITSDLPGAGMPKIATSPGRRPETSDVAFTVPAESRINGFVLGDNYGSPNTGRNRVSGGVDLNAPLGIGDRLTAFGILSETSELKNGRVAYAVPLGVDGIRGEIAAFRTTYALGGVYKDLDATGTADAISGTLMAPIVRLRNESIYLTANYTHKNLHDMALGISTAFRKLDVGTLTAARDTSSSFFGLPLLTNASVSFSYGNVDYPDYAQWMNNVAGVNTVGDFSKVNVQVSATLGLTEDLSLTAAVRAQKSFSGNLDSSEQFALTGFWAVRSYDEGLAGDTGFLFQPELRYQLPGFGDFKHSLGVFTDIGAVKIEDASYTTTQKDVTWLSDVGLAYYASYEYAPGRALLLKAHLAHTYGSRSGAESYDRGTKGLVQLGVTF